MIWVLILLSIIAICEVSRLVITYRPSSKKQHFKQKLDSVNKMVWDLEFKNFKTAEIREDIRQEYDNRMSRLEVVETRIKALPEDPKKHTDEDKRLFDDQTRLKRDIERFKAQMEALDIEMHGTRKSEQYPDGVDGTDQQIESLHELTLMLKDWMKKV